MWKILIIGVGFMKEDGKEIKYKDWKEANQLMQCIKGCFKLIGKELELKEE